MRTSSLLPLLLAPSLAQAAELTWNGGYRARGLLFDSLSLSDTNSQAEGTSNLIDHRLRLQPTWFMNERVALYAQIDALNLVPWGADPEVWTDPVTGDPTDLAWSDTVQAPLTEEGAASPTAIQVTRAWGEVYTGIGRLRFGRVPLQWGAGLYLNDGLAPDAEYGDTADRIQLTSRAGLLYMLFAWDVQYEGYLNDPDDMQSASVGLAYQSELAGVGLLNRYRYQPSQSYNAYTGDLWFFADLGPARVEGEVAAVLGSGDLQDGANNVRIGAVGALLKAEVAVDRYSGGIEGGVATGDADPDDSSLKTFSFDRDYNVSLLLFEEPLPTLAAQSSNATNEGRDYDAILTGEGIRNALFVRPHFGYRFLPHLQGELSVLAARAAKLPEGQSAGYGTEVDLNLQYTPYEHFYARSTLGVLFPGKYFTTFEDEELGGGFDTPALGGMLMAGVQF